MARWLFYITIILIIYHEIVRALLAGPSPLYNQPETQQPMAKVRLSQGILAGQRTVVHHRGVAILRGVPGLIYVATHMPDLLASFEIDSN